MAAMFLPATRSRFLANRRWNSYTPLLAANVGIIGWM